MPGARGGLAAAVLWLDVLATPLLLFILAGIWVFREQIFVIGSPLTFSGLIILVGFASILVFNLASLILLIRYRADEEDGKTASTGLFVLGLVCLVLLAAQKVMADEVAHETVEGWSIQGEYLMLYGMLLLQLLYNLLVGRRLLALGGQTGKGADESGRP